MNNSSLLNFWQHTALFFKLLIPLNVLRWVLAFVAILWVLALLLEPSSDWGFVRAIAMAVTGLMAFLLLMLIPNQVIALSSSRPVSLLGNSRHTMLICLLVFASLISWIMYWALNFEQDLSAVPSLILVIWLMVSLLLQLCVLVCSRWPNGQGLIFILAWVWVQVADWFLTLNPLLLSLAWLASWLLFFRWWLRWQPKKYQPNSMVAVINDSQAAAVARNAGFLWQPGKADTWLGSRFFGAPDSWRSRRQRLLVGGLIFLLTPIPGYWMIGKEQLEALILYALIPFLMFMSGSIAQGMAVNFIRNLRSVWLYYPGTRQSMLNLAWRLYVREMGIWVLLMFGLASVIELFWGQGHDARIWLYSVVTIFLMNSVSFYLAWWVYLRSQGSLLWCNWIGGVAVMLLMMLFIATGLLFPLPFDWQGISIAWTWLPQLILIALLYNSVRSGFSRMNFVRVA